MYFSLRRPLKHKKKAKKGDLFNEVTLERVWSSAVFISLAVGIFSGQSQVCAVWKGKAGLHRCVSMPTGLGCGWSQGAICTKWVSGAIGSPRAMMCT